MATDGHNNLVELLIPVSFRDPSKEIYNRKGKLFELTNKNEVTEVGVGGWRLKKRALNNRHLLGEWLCAVGSRGSEFR